MGDAIGQMLPSAIGVALSPLPIVAVVLMLVTPRGRVNGLAFILGWWVGLGLLGAIFLSIAGGLDASDTSGPATWVSVVELILAGLLLLLAAKQFRSRPAGDEEPPAPKWMGALDQFTPIKAALAGVVLTAANPKNLLLSLAAAAQIAATDISAGDEVVVWVIFVLIATIGVGTPVVIAIVMGERSRVLLDRLKAWMAHNNAVIMATILLLIGVKMLGSAIAGFSD